MLVSAAGVSPGLGALAGTGCAEAVKHRAERASAVVLPSTIKRSRGWPSDVALRDLLNIVYLASVSGAALVERKPDYVKSSLTCRGSQPLAVTTVGEEDLTM
jgi:hypothetical protein